MPTRRVVANRSAADPYARAAATWKSFLRGHHPILMDFGLIGGVGPPDPSAGGRGVCDAMGRRPTGGIYLNFPGLGEQKEALVRAGYGVNYEGVATIVTRKTRGA